MKKIYLALMLALSASVGVHAQRVSEGFGTSLTPSGWTLSNPSGLLLRDVAVNGYQTAVNAGCVKADNYNVGFETSTLETYSFTPTTANDSLRFDVSAAAYTGAFGSDVDSLTIYAYNGTAYSVVGAWETQVTVDAGITTAAATSAEFVPSASSQWRTKVLALPVGTTKVMFSFTSQYGNQIHVDNIVVDSFYTAGMLYSSSTTTQTVTSGVLSGKRNQQIIGIEITTTGNQFPVSVTDFFLSTGSSTSISSDIDSVKIFSTGTSAVFDTINRFGALPTPPGFFNISGSQVLSQGTNYFWLVYDIKPTAIANDVLDATCDMIYVGATGYVPTVTSPVGQRKIISAMSGAYTIGSGGTYNTLSAAIADLNIAGMSGNTEFSIISNTTEPGAVIINKWTETGAGGYSLRIAPTVADTIFANAPGSGAIMLLGASRVTIDGRIGGTGNNLTVINTNTLGNHAAILIGSSGTGLGCSNDTIRNLNIMAGSNSALTIGLQAQGDNNNNLNIIDNVFKRAQIGINVFTTNFPAGANAGLRITGNTLGDVSLANTVNQIGISITNSPASLISKNKMFNLDDPASELTVGIQVNGNSNGSVISGNKIDSVMNSNIDWWAAYGINVAGSDSLLIANNVISRVAITNNSVTNTTYNPFGIRITSGSAHKIVYNSVNLFGNSLANGATGSLSAALLVTGGTNLVVRNNIFANTYEGLTGSASYSIYVTATTPFATINNNNYYFGGAYGSLGYLTSARANMAAWKSATTQDANSTSSNPYFTSNSDLTINSGAVGTEMESGGAVIAGVTTDYNGDARPKTTPTTYGGNTAPDMGAFEFDGQPADLTAPAITYTIIANTVSTANRTLTAFASVTDLSGINTTSGTNPRLYYKKKNDANVFGNYPSDNQSFFNGWKYVEATNTTSPFSFSIDNSILTGGSVSAGDSIYYFVTAQDLAATPNVGANPATGFAATSVGSVSSAPTTPNYYIIISGPLNGLYTVGSLQTAPNYTTLTSAIADLNLRGIGSAVTFELQDNNYSTAETFPLAINAISGVSSTNTITIRPASGVTSTITGSSATAIFKITGTDYLTVEGSNNGSSTRDLSVINTNATGTIFWIGNATTPLNDAASNITVKNCIVKGNTPSSTVAAFLVGSGTTLGGAAETSNYNISILNNEVTRAQNGVFAIGNATSLDSNWVISNNTFGSATPADKMGYRGIAIQSAKYFTIEGNTIAGITISSTNPAAGILAGLLLNTGSISKNKITNIANTNAGGYGAMGIYLNSTSANTNITIANNFISEVTGFGYGLGWGFNDNGYGIMVNSGGNYKIYFNTISLTANQGSAGNSAPINIASVATNLSIRNNIFVNAQTTGTRYAIYTLGTSAELTAINYNNYSAASVGYLGSAKTTLADWKSATAQDANSQSIAVTVTSASDLHLTGPSIGDVNLACPAIAGITTDIDGDVRNTVTPWHYMGADENTSSPLPVELTRFTAVAVKKAALLEWTTASETNNEKFMVERSLDGKSFRAVGAVKGAGNSARAISYSFTDEQAAAFAGASAKVYYRIVQVDFNGRSSASAIAAVQFGNQRTNELSAYPNPAVNEVTLAMNATEEGQMNVTIADIQGREVYAGLVNVVKGTNNHQVNINNLEAGIYFVKATLNGNAFYYKIYKN